MSPNLSNPWQADPDDVPAPDTASPWGAARADKPPGTPDPHRRSLLDRPTIEEHGDITAEERPRRQVLDLTDGTPQTPIAETTSMAATRQQEPIVDLRRPTSQGAIAPTAHYGLGPSWGATWEASTQGWARNADGSVVWRPVVTTTEQLALWDVDRYLGVVTAEVAATIDGVGTHDLGAVLSRARQVAVEGLTAEAVERGAHAVVGVSVQYTPVGRRLIVTLTGTAVTLREKRS